MLMKIREAITADIDKIHILGNSVNEFNVSNEVVTFWPKHILHNCIVSETDYMLIAEEKNKIIGFIIINNSPVFKKAIIENIFVSPHLRRRGVAKKLLTAAINKVVSTDCEYICTLTENNSNAADFYISNGFNKGKNFVWLDKIFSDKFSKEQINDSL